VKAFDRLTIRLAFTECSGSFAWLGMLVKVWSIAARGEGLALLMTVKVLRQFAAGSPLARQSMVLEVPKLSPLSIAG
jgi:hypothetical protein